MSDSFYITTTTPYVNADPHIGFATEIIRADIIARYHRLLGENVFFNTGTDEHGVKVYSKAKEAKKDPQKYVDEYAIRFRELKGLLNLTNNTFIRTTDPHHKKAAQEFWKRCDKAGDIYKKNYKRKYCVGCELDKTDSELDKNGCCPLHPDKKLEIIEEENYFFKWSKYQKPLLDFYEAHPHFVVPEFRFREIKKFVKSGLQDFSISRLKENMPWGVPVPGDSKHVMYVWFDALVNYISTIGWPEDEERFQTFWPGVQVAGKDQVRQQAAMWQAMLLSAGLPTSDKIMFGGFINVDGKKMSKSAGNVTDPFALVDEYGTEALRYYLSRHIHPFEDTDYTPAKFKASYNAGLSKGLGNLVSRIMKMAVDYNVPLDDLMLEPPEEIISSEEFEEYRGYIERFELNKAADVIWSLVAFMDSYIEDTKPFKTIDTDEEKAHRDILFLAERLWEMAALLTPFMPETAESIREAIKTQSVPEALFLRK